MNQHIAQNQKENSLLSLRLDAVLKLYFAKKENEEQLRQFLKATTHLTDDDLVTIDIKNPVLTKQHVQEKDFIVDIHLTSATGERVIIEMQMQNHDGFFNRMIAYNARQYASQLERGENYTKLKSSISLIIVDFEMFDDTDEFYDHILLRRKNTKVFTNALQFYILDLTKIPNDVTQELSLWGKLFKVETEEELEVLMNESDDMKTAGAKLLELSADKEAQELAEARKLSQWAWNHTLHATEERAHKEGIEQGIEQGRQEEKFKMAISLKLSGMELPEIIKHTGLSENEIMQLTPQKHN